MLTKPAEVDIDHAAEIISRVENAHDTGTLTKRIFMDAWGELKAVLGDGIEREGIEALVLFADPAWLPDLGL
jgi:hypothetical protein